MLNVKNFGGFGRKLGGLTVQHGVLYKICIVCIYSLLIRGLYWTVQYVLYIRVGCVWAELNWTDWLIVLGW